MSASEELFSHQIVQDFLNASIIVFTLQHGQIREPRAGGGGGGSFDN